MNLFVVIAIVAICYWFFRSPLCDAVSDSIRTAARAGQPVGRADAEVAERLRALTEEVRALRGEVVDLEERLEFTERALVGMRQRDAVPGGRGA